MGLRRSLGAGVARGPALVALAVIPTASALASSSDGAPSGAVPAPGLPFRADAALSPQDGSSGTASGILTSASGQALAPAARPRPHIRVRRQALDLMVGQAVAVRGTITGVGSGASVALEARVGRRWRTIARGQTRSQGRFQLRARARVPSGSSVRVRFNGGARFAPATRIIGRIRIYRVTYASWYGPGWYGNRTACGRTLTPSTLGVAHRTLPCGTQVSLRKGSRTVHVPVIDRGPYVGGREWDLTTATAQRLGFAGVGPVLASL